MPLDALQSWDSTRDSLHSAAEVVGRIRKARVPKQPNALHLALFVTADGLTTGPMDDGSSLELHFAEVAVRGRTADGRIFSVPLEGQTVAALLGRLAEALQLDTATLGSLNEANVPLVLDRAQARGYADALNAAYTGLARFRARLSGTMTPLVVWPHGFDLSGLWFPGQLADEQTKPHVNFGFSPGSAGLPRPYLYAYAWPWPDGAESQPLPVPARWHIEGWKGALLDYDEWRKAADPARAVEQAAADFFTALGDLASQSSKP
jgi:hypothetical protein